MLAGLGLKARQHRHHRAALQVLAHADARILANAQPGERGRLVRVDRRHRGPALPGFNPSTGLGRDANVVLRLLARAVTPLLPFVLNGASTTRRAARVLDQLLTSDSSDTSVYYEKGAPMSPSMQVRDGDFRKRVVAETRAFLSAQ